MTLKSVDVRARTSWEVSSIWLWSTSTSLEVMLLRQLAFWISWVQMQLVSFPRATEFMMQQFGFMQTLRTLVSFTAKAPALMSISTVRACSTSVAKIVMKVYTSGLLKAQEVWPVWAFMQLALSTWAFAFEQKVAEASMRRLKEVPSHLAAMRYRSWLAATFMGLDWGVRMQTDWAWKVTEPTWFLPDSVNITYICGDVRPNLAAQPSIWTVPVALKKLRALASWVHSRQVGKAHTISPMAREAWKFITSEQPTMFWASLVASGTSSWKISYFIQSSCFVWIGMSRMTAPCLMRVA
ncbi:Hypothetical_protein [Hexamita inflata]|uniref:Hypothetical_protein n=1 Tax=Hexamita inflata TaxID=28002 RepID=A0ABP1KTD1_9EUKA